MSSNPEAAPPVDVIVIGAGISGLMAASDCFDAGLNVRVLEARDRLGGRTYTKQHDGKLLEMGGGWVNMDIQPNIAGLITSLGLTPVQQYDNGKRILELEKEVIRNYSGDIPNVSPFALVDTQFANWGIDRMANGLSAAAVQYSSSGLTEQEKEWDSITVAGWVRKHMWTLTGTKFIDLTMRALFGVEAEEMSMLWFLRYVRTAGSLAALIETQQAQRERIKEGAQSISERLASRLPNSQVHLSSPVMHVDRSAPTGFIAVHVAGLREPYLTKTVIFAIPPSQLIKLQWTPTLPPRKTALAPKNRCFRLLHEGKFIFLFDNFDLHAEVCCLYNEPFWRSEGVSGQSLSHCGPISLTLDTSDPSGTYGSMTAFVISKQGEDWSQLSVEERKEAVLNHLVVLYKDARFGSPTHYEEQDWSKEEFTGGCPVNFMAPGTMTMHHQEVRRPLGTNIFFAGTETATVWTGYMDGAVEAGRRAAKEAKDFLTEGLTTRSANL
ncbi:hypothetical protein DFJ73DRAFT_855412 [Zopfochytrium polystomum]|nr:hypothetical protein DFJ73DRAFT_855412 [Zopfochytrium polystomum]